MFRDMRFFFMPGGLQMVNSSYRKEVGHATMVASQISPEHKKMLRKLGTGNGNLYDEVTEWLAVADRLGELDHERSGILPKARGATPAQHLKARNRWIRVVDLMRQTAALRPENVELGELMDRVRKAREQAARRRAEHAAASPAEPEPAGTKPAAQGDVAAEPKVDPEVESESRGAGEATRALSGASAAA
jgi:hypothetical protein